MAGVIDSNEGLVAAYLAFAALCFLAASSTPRMEGGARDRVWLGAACLLLALGIARELEVESLVIHTGRELAWSTGLYDSRRPFQAALVGATLGIGVVFVGALLHRLRHRDGTSYVPVLAVVGALVVFALVRTLSFHNVDQVLYSHQVAGVSASRIIEMLLLIAGSALAIRATGRAYRPGWLAASD